MLSAALRKSITDLTRRRARALFAVATLALAVASVSFFAIPTLIDRSMQREARADRLADLSLGMRPMAFGDSQLSGLAALPNVAAVEPRSSVETRVLVGRRRAAARIIGVRDFERQRVDLVRVVRGRAPRSGEVVVDVQDANTGVYSAGPGATATIVGAAGARQRLDLRVSGEARNIDGGEQVQDEGVIVLYAPAATVAKLSGETGYRSLSVRLDDASPAAAARTAKSIERSLRALPGFTHLTALTELRAPGDWPGKEETEAFADLVSVITLLALLSAVVLISNTMTTLVAEQTGEIGIMRALGARRRDVALVYVRTALLLGAAGAIAGTLLGIAISSLAAASFGRQYWAVDVPPGADAGLVAAGFAVGLIVPPLAALPAIRRGVRVDLREALEATGSVTGGQTRLDRMLRRATFLPRSVQLGLRSVGRRKRRSLATVLIVALAVGNLLAVLGLAAAATEVTRGSWDDHGDDARIFTSGRNLFDARAEAAIRATPGVAAAHAALVSDVRLGGEEAVVWGMPQRPLFRYRMSEGRWYTAGEERARAPVTVIERGLARLTGLGVGDSVTAATAGGPVRLRVIGIAKNQQEEGSALFVPLSTVRAALGEPSGASTYWVKGASSDEAFVDGMTARLEDRLTARGYDVGTEITYIAKRDEIAANRSVTSSIAVLGFLIVAMSMVGLANAITTSILERTREIGVLRCIGARARDIRRIFATEGAVLAAAGWLVAVPVGYGIDRAMVALLKDIANVDLPALFPLANLPLALAGTILLALAITLLPIRRAVRFRPGDALRYG